jgi:ABC-2 type transport system ATP-binding protein
MNITKTFGQTRAINGLTVDISCGNRVALLGPNGAGKSTVLKLLVGLMKPDFGDITLGGYPVDSMEAKKLLGYLPEDATPYISLTVKENLQYVGAIRGVQDLESRIDYLVSELGLQDFLSTKILKVSRGTRQKVSVAMSIIHQPRIVLMDEPLNYLDIPSQENVIQILSRMNSTFLISTHIMSIAERLTDDVIIMARGQEIWKGKRNELRNLGQSDEPVEAIISRMMKNVR